LDTETAESYHGNSWNDHQSTFNFITGVDNRNKKRLTLFPVSVFNFVTSTVSDNSPNVNRQFLGLQTDFRFNLPLHVKTP